MDLTHIALIAIIQGLTEFLPVSSSAHLALIPIFTQAPDQGLTFDVAVHVGSLVAVLTYFHKDLSRIICAFFKEAFQKNRSFDANLGWYLIGATIPAALLALLLEGWIGTVLRSPWVIAGTSMGYGILLGVADKYGPQTRSFTQIRWRDALWIGCAQALALVPGTSRSGITMTAGRFLGFSREAAARFSFLLSVPVILMAGLAKGIEVWKASVILDWHPFFYGGAIAAVVALLTIHFFMRLVGRIGMMPFVIYRLLLGTGLVIWLLTT